MKYIKDNFFFMAGMICFLSANIPSLIGAFVHNKTAPIGFLILIQLGLLFYFIDTITQKRPFIFGVANVINSVLNLIVIFIALRG